MKHSLPLRALSRLLQYPDRELIDHLSEVAAALYEMPKLSKKVQVGLEEFVNNLEASDLMDSQENYVECFDRGRATSLHLFEHVHGDSRERGQAMVDLLQTYKEGGLQLSANELPDHLSIILEFASTLPLDQAKQFVGEMAHILNAVYSTLVARNNRYAWLIAAAIEFSGEKFKVVELKIEEESMDEEWAEPPAFGGCSTRGQSKPGEEQPLHFMKRAKELEGVQS
jgi:nitrate reductase molybdenum cofactor assembly chaperone NarJ/NarW